jgi:hypothetical protein
MPFLAKVVVGINYMAQASSVKRFDIRFSMFGVSFHSAPSFSPFASVSSLDKIWPGRFGIGGMQRKLSAFNSKFGEPLSCQDK